MLAKCFDRHKIQGRPAHGGYQRLTATHVGPAHVNDWVGGKATLKKWARQEFERLILVLADSDYYDQTLAEWTHILCG
jgi:putative transposase